METKKDSRKILKEEGFLLAKRGNIYEDEKYLDLMLNNYKSVLEREIDTYLQKINPNGYFLK